MRKNIEYNTENGGSPPKYCPSKLPQPETGGFPLMIGFRLVPL